MFVFVVIEQEIQKNVVYHAS